MSDLDSDEVYEAFSEYEKEDEKFLEEFNNTNFMDKQKQIELEKEKAKSMKEEAKLLKQQQKDNEKLIKEEAKLMKLMKKKKPNNNESDDLFSNNPTPILGLNKRQLLAKIQSYKNLFPELKTMKLKRNATEGDMNLFIEEMDAVISTSNINQFLTDSILQSIKMIEPISARYENYNITGLSDILKANKDFHKLAKQLYLKYNVFSSVPVEYQMIMLITTSVYIVKQKNKNKGAINNFLNEEITINE